MKRLFMLIIVMAWATACYAQDSCETYWLNGQWTQCCRFWNGTEFVWQCISSDQR